MKYADQLAQWDEWIRQGQASKVRSLCRKLNPKKIPRELLADYGHIARRVGAPDLILLWLGPIVRSEKALDQEATIKEKALYALGLLRLGAFGEAKQILSEIDPELEPQVYFYRASMNINQWNYSRAIPDLKRYVQHPDIVPYSKLVGRLNLCAALLAAAKKEQADQEIAQLMRKLENQQGQLLRGNLLEIRSQLLIEQGQFQEALRDLSEASEILQKADERSRLYVEKWQLIIQLKSNENKSVVLRMMEDLKHRALNLGEWEIIRDCDLHRALALKDRDLILRVFWGSQFAGYKKRVMSLFGEFKIEDSFLWASDLGQSFENLPVINLVDSAPTPILKKLFFILTREFYQPLRITEILDFLYSGEYYHPTASPAKLHRLITRARQWLEQEKHPVQITSFRNAYKIEFSAPCKLQLMKELSLTKPLDLPSVIHQGFFSTKDWALEKAISERTARQQIQKLVEAGQIEMQARGPRTRYRLK